MVQAILLRYNLPAKVIPIQQIESINSQSEVLVSVNLIGGDHILGYHIKFETR